MRMFVVCCSEAAMPRGNHVGTGSAIGQMQCAGSSERRERRRVDQGADQRMRRRLLLVNGSRWCGGEEAKSVVKSSQADGMATWILLLVNGSRWCGSEEHNQL